jgi:hypothetical protein
MNDDGQDVRDPLRAAFDDYQRAPRDVVPRTVEHTVDDLRRLADCGAEVLVTHYEVHEETTETGETVIAGIVKRTEWVAVTQPIMNNREDDNQ